MRSQFVRRAGLYLSATMLIASVPQVAAAAAGPTIADSAAVDSTPGLGPSDVGFPSVMQPDTGTTASAFLSANRSVKMGSVSVLQVRPNVYMLTVQGSNFALLTEPQGSVVVDSGGTDCEAVVAAVRQVTAVIRGIIDCSGLRRSTIFSIASARGVMTR